MLYSPTEIMENYTYLGKEKAEASAPRLFVLGVIAGFIIAISAFVSSAAGHTIENPSISRVICGTVFAMGVGVTFITGAELFTGDCMMVIAALSKKTGVSNVLRTLAIVFLGNIAGGVSLAAAVVVSGHIEMNDGALAIYSVKIAAEKCEMGFGSAFALGFLCNILTCASVLCGQSATNTAGKIVGSYIPVIFYIIAGFENAVANMYYIPVGIFAAIKNADLAGAETEALSWGGFLAANMAPVALGNIAGGAGVATLLWVCRDNAKTREPRCQPTLKA
ncbi:MAG: formate/nitrite transporter family protein [Clostridiales bacterium]|nr:formate/nitrite transporter family protein [Clostridiales bacterium]